MLQYLIERSVANRYLVLFVVALLSALGIWTMVHTPVDAIPDVSDVQVIVKTDFPGQGPQIVEEQVTYPLASALMAVPGASTVRGYSMFGTSFIYVIFEDGTDLYWARSRVLEYLNQVSGGLPESVSPTLGPDATGAGWVYQYSLSDTSGTYDLSELRALQDFFLKYELQALEGVAEVAAVGGFRKQYQVVVDPQRLAAFGIPLSTVKRQLERSNQDSGGRLLEVGEREFVVRSKGYIGGIQDIRAVPLRAASGSAVTIGDVATVQLGPEIRRGITDKNGEGEVIGGIVVMRSGGNAMQVIERVKSRVAELEPGLPPGVRVVVEYDRSKLISRAVDTLTTKIWQELLVVGVVVMLFLLHARSALVALITIPVGILVSLGIMYLLGINANIMSLGGIAIAIGVMVDASLVMVENAHRHIERNDCARLDAVRRAAVEIGPSLFFSLLIVTISFLPVFTLQQVEGRLFRPLAFTKTFAMGASAILAITLVPALTAVFLRGRIRNQEDNPVARALIGAYRPVIRTVLRRPLAIVAAAVAILGLTVLPVQQLLLGRTLVDVPQIGSEFMPPLDEGDLLYMPSTLPGVSPRKAAEILQQTDRIIASFPEVAGVFGKIGRAETATDPAPLSMVETTIALKPKSEWRPGVTSDSLVSEMDAALQIPGLTNVWTMPIKNRNDMLATGIKTPVGIKIAGPDLTVLEGLGAQIEGAIGTLAGTRSVFAERVMGGSFLDLEIDRFAAARHGLTVADVQEVVQAAVGGMNVTSTVEGLERHPVNIRYPRALRDDLESLRAVLVATHSGPVPEGPMHSATGMSGTGGGFVPLGQLAALRTVKGPPMIKSENARPNAWVFIDLESGQDVGSYVQRAKEAVAQQVELPPGYSVRWSGQFENMERVNQRLRIVVPLTVALIFLLLLVHFRSGTDASVLMATLPFAVVGAVWLMVILGYHMSIAAAVGFIAVAGLAAETGVVMVAYLHEALERHRQDGRLALEGGVLLALEEGAVQRVRPLVMTVLTTLLALLPVMIGSGTGSEIMKRIAAPMVGGLVSATILTLVVLPAIYMLVVGSRIRRGGGLS